MTLLDAGCVLAFAYPDRIGKRRAGDGGRYQLANGRGASFANPEAIAREELIVAVELDDREREAQIQLAAPLARSDLLEHFARELVTRDEVAWDARAEAVVARRTVRFGELVLEEKPLQESPPGATGAALLEGLRSLGLEALPWDDDSRDLRRAQRVRARAQAAAISATGPIFRSAALAADLDVARAVPRRRHAPRALRARAARSRRCARG